MYVFCIVHGDNLGDFRGTFGNCSLSYCIRRSVNMFFLFGSSGPQPFFGRGVECATRRHVYRHTETTENRLKKGMSFQGFGNGVGQ